MRIYADHRARLQTLVNTVLRKYASKELMEKYMPKLSTEWVSSTGLLQMLRCLY